jgi:hypothetical protein
VWGYYFWFAIYIILGVATIALPGIAAMGFADPTITKLLAGSGALASAVFAFLKPHEYATAYDAAATAAWKAALRARMGQLPDADALKILSDAIDKTMFKYGGLPTRGG